MNHSLKLLANVMSVVGISAGLGLAAVAQPSPSSASSSSSDRQIQPPMQPMPSEASPAVEAAPLPQRPTQLTQPSDTTLPESSQSQVSVPKDSAALSIDAIVQSSDSFKLFNSLLRVADRNGDLSRELAGDGTYTVFAPTDAAFAALPEGTIKKLVQPENRKTLIKILSYHVLPGEVDSSQIKPGSVKSIEGSALNIQTNGSTVSVNDAQVIQPDIKAKNGVIHAVNKVILPPDVQASLNTAPQASRSMNSTY